MSSKKSLSEVEKRHLLFDYWDTIPLVIYVDIPVEEVLTHDVRDLIIYYIRKGKEEKDKDGKIRIRHGFSAKELLDMANKKLKEKMKLQSMYFHIMKLQEFGLLKTVVTLHEGRHNIAYFGRTARAFNWENKKKDQNRYKELFKEGGKYARAIDEDLSVDLFSKYAEDFIEILKENENKSLDWIKKNEQFINENKIDIAYIFSFLKRVNYANPKLTKLLCQIAKLIDYEL
ncbi:MAG: hypothetical protein FK733_18985 [Asgard group archaeon]|nr:hypothetical protein [Asgard group archaeon]